VEEEREEEDDGANGSIVSKQATIFNNGDAERMRILSTGGLTFNGDTATANALDDYEEGTWTPVAAGVAVTSLYSATYTKIGRQVIAECYINLNTQNNSNQFQISGLPYAAASGSTYGGGSIGYVGSADWGSFGAPIISPSNSYAYFHHIDGTHGNSVTNAELYTLNSGNLLFLGQFIYTST
jgi:hypothetical protein